MRSDARARVGRCSMLGLALLLAAAVVPAPARHGPAGSCLANAPGEEASRAEPCCFANPAYAGVCEVQPGQDETCATILAYLNNPGSAGKAYCNSTTTRGGWKQVACEKAPEPK